MIVKLTPDFVANNLVCPEGKRRIEYVDKGGTGLYVEVRATSPGQGTFYWRYKDASNTTRHIKLGTTSSCELETMREKVKILRAKNVLNDLPHNENDKSTAPTLETFFQDHYLPHCKVHNRGWKKKAQMFDHRVKEVFGNKRLNQIKRHAIAAWHVGLREDGLSPAYADRFLALLRHALNLAVEWEMLEKSPAAGAKLFNIDNRSQRFLDESELSRFLGVLETDKNRTVCLIVLFLLSTGARLNEALKAKWKDIDITTRLWRIPASNSKSKKFRTVPLNDSTLKVLSQLDTEDTFEYLFINRKTSKPYTTISKTFSRLTSKAKLKDWTPHSCRHQYASFLVGGGRTLYEVQQILGHSEVDPITDTMNQPL